MQPYCSSGWASKMQQQKGGTSVRVIGVKLVSVEWSERGKERQGAGNKVNTLHFSISAARQKVDPCRIVKLFVSKSARVPRWFDSRSTRIIAIFKSSNKIMLTAAH